MTKRTFAAVLLFCLVVSVVCAQSAATVFGWPTSKISPTADGLNVGGILKTATGTAALPAYSFSSDPNTGVYSPAADSLGFALNGQYRGGFGTNSFSVGNQQIGSSSMTLFTDPDATHVRLQAAKNDVSFNMPISINPLGGNVLIGTADDVGSDYKLQIDNGGILVDDRWNSIGDRGLSSIGFQSGKIGGTLYGGLYGPSLLYNVERSSGSWKLIGGGTGSAVTIEEGTLTFSNSQSGSPGDAVTWYDRFIVQPSGNVLIATTTDDGANKLQVNGNIKAVKTLTGDGTAAAPAYSFGSDPNTGIYSAGADRLGFSLGGAAKFAIVGTRLEGLDDMEIGPDTEDTADNKVLELCGGGDNDTGRGPVVNLLGNDIATYGGQALIYAGNVATGKIVFYTANAERVTIASSGNVLIGTTTDDGVNKLQVSGEAKFSLNSTGAFKQTYAATGANAATATVFVGDIAENGDMVTIYLDIVGSRDGPGYEKFHVMIGAYNNAGTIVFVDDTPTVTSDISLGLGMTDPLITCEAASNTITIKMTVLDAYSRLAINTTAAGYVTGVK